MSGAGDVFFMLGLRAAREFLRREIALGARRELEAAYARVRVRAPYAPTQDQIGPRGLANLCLAYLGAIDDGAARGMCAAQFDAADNMTDSVGALAAMNDSDSREREALFARFEARWRDEPLVLDKWFSLQAMAHHPATLSRVRMR